MTQRRLLASLLVASTVIGGGAYAAEQAAGSSPMTSTAQKAADRDIGKLSADGAQAFRDMHMARVAIFDANPDQAKSLISNAQAALGKAKTDETVFTKAEADLKKPATAANGNATSDKASSDQANGAAKPEATKPIAWLPVDGQLTLADDFVATPQKASAVSDANKTLAKGDQKGAVEKLKLAGVDVNFTMAVIPLDSTTTDVDQTAKLLEQGKYYEANAILKQAEDGLRLDVFDAAAIPQKAANAQPAKTDPHSAATDTTESSGAAKSSTH
ncbi:YfdX family protein [Methylobacterium sp. C25]|uniref:YfdX family protein n=1 Tax=Methylobacterium sp. C25 TaxID=2721622 RepID=UPI001F2F50EE|nr:YfdX family protein [Methylobacterium sp. C25]MCE4224952.1 YfdX family protein [Methylobacterium sp. C25]